ncbi:3-phosphoserine/phosphohydroxythreonine transaminase [Pseudenhygromyxa sp. WMMC2535]|uniref:3-phosphoserine/phosphohydroxythreonine transaminase n=1 Tax=Pseudenhygromyxa sp. WMMC2535 TaxID=2712867 RepID=UPI001557959D|nr:3-phosphoserine/phosphohydroxythreonine transaminase [Pseudenhygromyxa sp. WMMC2535]NVB39073.1 3-phosphoserine/phosphohydroxythreonine transaminase [Pseudenhygromyxa sp. WMMC2535]
MAATPIYNFSAGPAILPPEVFERAAEAVRELRADGHAPGAPGIGLSLLEISHRSKPFAAVHEAAIALSHEVLGIPDTHEVLLLQGGASLQFAMVPLNFATPGAKLCYADTGAWSSKAIKESREIAAGGRGHETVVVSSAKQSGYDHIPALPALPADATYLHLTSNNTIYGTEYATMPEVDVPLVVDASSDIGSRPMGLERAAIGYAGAQKNLGPSGVTLVWIDRSWLEREVPAGVPNILRYKTHADAGGLFNTPNTFGVLVLELVLEWVKAHGGVEAMAARNMAKADALYAALDGSSLYVPHARADSRSRMNVTWTLGGAPEAEREALTKRFLSEAAAAGLDGLKGHRSVGGCRASIYNAFPVEGVTKLVDFMAEFERKA